MELQIEYISADNLKPYKRNNKKHKDFDVGEIARSIEKYGMNDPIGIWKDNQIIEGHGRLLACKKLGIDKVPCVRLDHLTDKQRREYAILHNKTAELAEYDFANLELELPDLDFSDFDIDFGSDFDDDEEIVEDDVPEVDEEHEPITKLGDIFELGRHRLMCGSATSEDDILKLIEQKHIHLIYTDPPYGMNAVTKSGVLQKNYKKDIIGDDDNKVAISAFSLVHRIFENVNQIWWGANYYTECLPSSECWIVWDKNNGASDQTDCELAWTNLRSVVRQFTMASEKKNRVHPTQKPTKLFFEIISKFDKNNDCKTVLDLFGGSGSTLIACEQIDRICYTMELDPKYCDVIIKRWENLTGEKAIKIN